MTASWAASTGQAPVLSPGDVMLAMFQSVAMQADFLQACIAQVNALARAQTSTGADLDSWMAQFGFTRLPAVYATGQITFTKLTPAVNPIQIAPGSIVQTANGQIQFQVITDTTEVAWVPSSSAYVLQPGQTTLIATVQAITAGSASNVAAAQITQIGSGIVGIDQVTNLSPITNGQNSEADANFRSRFVLYLSTLAKATKNAILAAIDGVQSGLIVALAENQQPNGTALPGSFTAFVDDGSGNPPSSLLNAVFTAVDAVRAFSVQPFVVGPSVATVSIAITIHVATGSLAATVNAAVQNAIVAYVNATVAGATLYISSLVQVALSVSGVQSVQPSTALINDAGTDFTPSQFQEARTNTSLVTVQNY